MFSDSVLPASADLPNDAASVEAELSDWDGSIERIASDLYRISSMLLGEGEDAIRQIEEVVGSLDVSACEEPEEARHLSRLALASQALAVLGARYPESLAAPAQETGVISCIEDDDLSAAGLTTAELERMMSGPDDHRLRDWLESLPVSLRAVFVLRAVAGLSLPELAGLLAESGGSNAQDWNPEGVRSTFRQALCSLASQLLHATAAK